MGGLPCMKAAMDGRAGADASVAKHQAALKKSLDCLQNTAMAAPFHSFTDPMEDAMLDAAKRYEAAVAEACEAYARVASKLEEEARANWPEFPGTS